MYTILLSVHEYFAGRCSCCPPGRITLPAFYFKLEFYKVLYKQHIQLAIYSCKKFKKAKAIELINEFWKSSDVKALFINKETEKEFKIETL